MENIPSPTCISHWEMPPLRNDLYYNDRWKEDNEKETREDQERGEELKPVVFKYLRMADGRDPEDVVFESPYIHFKPFIVHNEADRTYLVFYSATDFIRWFHNNSNIRTLHEVILGDKPQKLKFDIDASAEDLDKIECQPREGVTLRQSQAHEMFDSIVNAIIYAFESEYDFELPWQHLAISDSSSAEKFSRHIVIPGFYVANNEEAAAFTKLVLEKIPEAFRKFLDAGVNKSTQNFRLPFCHKAGSDRIKRMVWGDYPIDMIVTWIPENRVIKLPEKIVRGPQRKETVIEDIEVQRIIELAAPYSEGLTWRDRKGNVFNFTREFPSECKICALGYHDKDNTLFVTVNQGVVRAHCRRGGSVVLGQNEIPAIPGQARAKPIKRLEPFGDKTLKAKVMPGAKIPESFQVDEYCQQHLKPYEFGDCSTILVKSNMGTGKTKQLKESITDLPEDMGVIVISYRRTFTSEIKTKLGDGFVDYQDIKGEISAPRVIIQVESLHRLKLPVGKPFLLVLDETESIISQLENRQMVTSNTLEKCWSAFEWLCFNATNMIAMDAFADARTFTLLQETRDRVRMYHNTWCTDAQPTDIYYSKIESWCESLYEAIPKAGTEPIVIAGTSRKQLSAIADKIKAKNPELKVKYYNAESSAEEREDFRNVTAAWADVDVLMYSPTISAGCSFELERFTKMFCFFSDRSCDYKTAIQMMGRVRNISSREYHIFIKLSGQTNVPLTVEEIETAVARESQVLGITSNPLNMSMLINTEGQREYRCKDLYYRLHIGNIALRCQSRCQFTQHFQADREKMGAKLIRRHVDVKDAKAIKNENTAAIRKVAADDNTAIARAPEISPDEFELLQKMKDRLTSQEHNSMLAYKLREFYRVKTLTPEFVAKYNTQKMKRTYTNLNAVSTKEGTINAKINGKRKAISEVLSIQEELAGPAGQNCNILSRNDRPVQQIIAVELLNVLMPKSRTGYMSDGGRQFDRFEEKNYSENHDRITSVKVTRKELEDQMDAAIKILTDNAAMVMLKFDNMTKEKLKKRPMFKNNLELINSILAQTFDIKIAPAGNVSAKQKCQNYVLKMSENFTWNDDHKRWETK